MAQIHKLKIQGIRSFGPDDTDAQHIVFATPVTCIVGQNGCGKTTIIESLRFATTGHCPPGTLGGKSFVYDPKLSNTGDVKGQVKLQFKNVKNQIMQITRTLQVTQKLDKLELKTLDGIIDIKTDEGKLETTSGRCADIDNVMIRNLGISEAILDNVIFCHQDESCWPLDEPKKLKEKFDLIFDAAKYNKTSDVIAKIRKTKCDQLKQGKQALGFLHEFVLQFREKSKQLQRTTNEYDTNEASAVAMKEKKKPLEKKYRATLETERKFVELQSKISSLETKKTGLEQQQKELAEKISTPHEGTKQELLDIIDNFHNQIAKKKVEIEKQEALIAQLEKKDKDGLHRINEEQTKLGKLQKEEETYKETLQYRLELLQAIAGELQITIPREGPKSAKDVEAALKQVDNGVRNKDKDLQTLKKALQLEEQNLQKVIDKKRELKVEADQGVKALENQLADAKDQLNKTKAEISQVDSSVSQMSVLQARLDRADRDYQDAEQEMDCKESQQKIVDTQRERDRVDAEVSALNDELELLQQASSLQAEADVHRTTLNKKEEEIQRIKTKHHVGLVTLFKNVPERGLLNQLESLIKRKESDIKDLRTKMETMQKQQTKMEVENQHQHRKLEELEQLLEKNKASLLKECGKKDYDTAVAEVQEALRKSQDQKGELDSLDIQYSRYISALKKSKPCCPLCHRDFKAQKEAENLVAELSGKIEQLPTQKIETERSLKELQARHSTLLQLKPVHTKVAELQANEIPALKEKIDETEMELTTLRAEVDDLQSQLKTPEQHFNIAVGIRSDATVLEQHETEVKRLTRELQRIEQRLPNTGSGRTLAQAQEQQRALRTQVQRLQKEAETKQRELDNYQKRVNSLREQRNSLKEKLLKITAGAQKRAQLLERSKELTEQINTLEDSVENARETVLPARLELEAAEKAKEKAQIKNNTTLDAQRKELSTLQQKAENLKKLHANIETYEARGVARTLETVRSTVEQLQRQREEIMMKRQDISGRIDELNHDLASQQVHERELDDNLKMLEKQEQVVKITAELDELCNELGRLDIVELTEMKKNLESQLVKIERELTHMGGVQETLNSRIADIRKELDKDNMKNAERKYQEQLVKNKVLSCVCDDLQMYYTALNSSMIHFHQERMLAVNRIIRELWVSIYKGSDIDYIEIKTEPDKGGSSATRRTYNYRVVMVKRNSELDMRGRCSAGQKMLACMVIRIALAETFSANCGILALDEPTTNLDQNNIESLSASLVELAQSHRFHRNFQLIVITHDEDFIERLQQAGLMSYFYRISRSDAGHSQIQKMRVRMDDGDEDD